MSGDAAGTLALIGGEEWHEECRDLDAALLHAAGTDEVLVLPTAAAFEQPAKVVEQAERYFKALGASVTSIMALHRADADDAAFTDAVRAASLVYLSGGSPMHLRSVLKGSKLWEALLEVYRGGGVLAASGSGAVVLCDPMIDPRGGAYTVGLGLLANMAVFPHHDTVAEHLWGRVVDLRPESTVLAGIDEHTGLVRDPDHTWRVVGPGKVTLHGPDGARTYTAGPVDALSI